MDNNRARKYLSLIQELLKCPLGQEKTILADNSGLLDAGLAETIRQMKPDLAELAESAKVQFLLKLAQIIEQPETETNPTPEDEAIALPESVKQILAAFEQFIRGETWTKSRQLLETHSELSSEKADGMTQQFIASMMKKLGEGK